MDQPEGYVVKGNEYFICLLAKGKYGLKQSQYISKRLLFPLPKFKKFIQSHVDSNVGIIREEESYVILALYVNDAILSSNTIDLLKHI